jgi:hypothetical protein
MNPVEHTKQAVGQKSEDERRQPNTRRKERDLGSNQAPMRERLGGREGCVFLAVFLAVSTSASRSRGVGNPFHSVPSFQGMIRKKLDKERRERYDRAKISRGERIYLSCGALSITCNLYSSTSPFSKASCTLTWLIRCHNSDYPFIHPVPAQFRKECQALRHQATNVVDLRPRSCLGVGDYEAAAREPLGKLKTQHSPSLAFPEQLASVFKYSTSVKKKKGKGKERECLLPIVQ